MPREAREKKLFSTYLIQQTCDKGIVVFKTKKDRQIFLETVVKTKDKYGFKLYGLSIHKSGYEMVLYDHGNDITKIMKSLNISFAMQYKCEHETCKTVFKERYKSEILEPVKIEAAIRALPLCLYADQSLFDVYLAEKDDAEECLDCFDKAKEKLNELLDSEKMTFEEMLKKKALRNTYIKDFRKSSTLSLIDIGNLFGGLSESAICKILNK
jgi:hypothetical protein